MPRPQRGKKAKKNLKTTEYAKTKNLVKVSMQDLAICYCQGEGVGCGRILHASARYKHKRKEEKKALREGSPEIVQRYRELLGELSDDDDASLEHSGDDTEAAIYPEVNNRGTVNAENYGGDDGNWDNHANYDEYGGFDDDDGMFVPIQDDLAPEVRAAFALEAGTLEDWENQEESDREEVTDDEEAIEIVWDQANPIAGEEDEDPWRREMEAARWEEKQRLLLEIDQDRFTQEDLDDLQALAFNLKHKHTREALEDMAKMRPLSSPYIMKKKLEQFSELVDEPYDCCIDSCMAFTGPYKDLDACQICHAPRYDNRGKARNVFHYLPLIPRLQAFFKSERIIEMLRYRQEREPYDGTLRDVFDSEHFQTLLDTTVKIDGVEYPHKIGESEWDIFVGFTFDGVSLWRGLGSIQARASTTCWPAAVIIYSFNPTLRTRLEHVFSLGVIPGPHSPKHVNSFLFPFFSEARRGAIGIPTFHRGLDRVFQMRFYTIFHTADMPGLCKLNGGKGTGAICPCLKCRIRGLRDIGNKSAKTYYVPHQHPGDEEESQTDYLLDNPKTHAFFEEIWHELTQAETVAEYKQIQQEFGVTCVPILGLLPSIDIVKSFPYGLMHLLFENLAPNMVDHWKGTFKKLSPAGSPYILSDDTWKKIGEETIGSIRTTPSTMIRAMPDIWLHATKYTAESWAFWITWMAPYLLEDRLPARHYRHLLLLVDIIKIATSLEITPEMLDELDAKMRQWHAEYEELYYRYEMGRLSTCPLTIHALIHVAQATRDAGPLSRIWEYVTERFMGKIARNVTSRQYPFSQIAESVKKQEQLKTVAMKFGLEEELFQADRRRNWSVLGGQERMVLEINDTTVLMSPHEARYAWPDKERRVVAVYIKQAYGLKATAPAILKFLPVSIERWGKFRVKGERNVVRSDWAAGRISTDRLRDSSYVRVELWVDRNAGNAALPDDPELQVIYGQLLYVARVTLPATRKIRLGEGCDILLGLVRLCEDAVGDATKRPVWYTDGKKENLIAVNISTIQCAVGRVKVGQRWGILDLNYGCANTTFMDDDVALDGDDND